MRTYAELVKEAIREAHEKSENEYKKFEVGRTYRGKPNKKDFSNLRRKREFRRCKRKSKSPT